MSISLPILFQEQRKFAPKIAKTYDLFNNINFSECEGCSKCCYMPWLLEEEYEPHLDNFGGTVREIDSIAFVMDETRCRYAQEDRCSMYKDRPLDCRLFPLDIIEEDGIYWWVIFTTCPQNVSIRDKLIPLIPNLEKEITPAILEQYKKQISLTKEIYPPYKNRQYDKIQRFGNA
jgi:Fe-S-cluster containining protein